MNGIEIGRYFRVWFVDQKNITGSGNVENDEGWWKAEGHQMSQEARLGVWRGKATGWKEKRTPLTMMSP